MGALIEGRSTTNLFASGLGKVEEVNVSAGKLNVTTGAVGLPHNRYIAAVVTTYADATNLADFTANPVTDFTIVIPVTTSLTGVLVIFDAGSEATILAGSQFAISASATTDVAYERIPVSASMDTVFQWKSSTPISRVAFLAIGATAPIFISAV